MTGFEIGTLIIATVSLVFAGIELHRVAGANRAVAESNRIANHMAVLQLEDSLMAARIRWSDIAHDVLKHASDPEALTNLALRKAEAGEQYLNVADRLCASIRRGLIDEESHRQDYRDWVAEVVKEFEGKLGPATRHPNILAVHNAWKQDKSALIH